jgi:hypothetical protein
MIGTGGLLTELEQGGGEFAGAQTPPGGVAVTVLTTLAGGLADTVAVIV